MTKQISIYIRPNAYMDKGLDFPGYLTHYLAVPILFFFIKSIIVYFCTCKADNLYRN
jgi:hypothetical protein